MRGTVAKRIRREIYGEQAFRQVKYKMIPGGKKGSFVKVIIGLRQQYQDAKRDYMRGER